MPVVPNQKTQLAASDWTPEQSPVILSSWCCTLAQYTVNDDLPGGIRHLPVMENEYR